MTKKIDVLFRKLDVHEFAQYRLVFTEDRDVTQNNEANNEKVQISWKQLEAMLLLLVFVTLRINICHSLKMNLEMARLRKSS